VYVAAYAQEVRTLELDGGKQLSYTLLEHPANAHLLDANAQLEPTSALNTAKLVVRLLSQGRVEDAALLSNAPKARYARLQESFERWGPEDFERAYARYFAPENRIVGEAAIGPHRLIMWYLKDTDQLTGLFLVDIEGRLLIDDVPSAERSSLRRVLEAHRKNRDRPYFSEK